MRSRGISLIWKLVAINLLGVVIVIILAWQVIDHFAADYFMSLMKQYRIDPEVLHYAFLDTTHQFLLLSMVLGLGVVLLLSYFVTRQMMRTLTQMNEATRKLAAGDYSERINVTTHDEVGELGHAFNDMVANLERIEQMRKDLVANVAHELRTPLHNIRAQLEAMQDRLLETSPETVTSVHEEVLRLGELVDALHHLSQVDSETRFLNKQEFDLDGLIRELVALDRSKFEQKTIDLETVISPVTVSADSSQIGLAVRNLLRNLLVYTPRGGHASIRVSGQEDIARVEFINDGDGIRAEDLPHIFERFYRGEKSRSRDLGGAGIGLAIVKQVIESHHGAVGAESDPGRTRIWFTLPR